MCGIAGYFARDLAAVPREPIEPMLLSLRHRGPDGYGVYYSDHCVLGHARLSIIDLEGGWQPIFNESGRLAVTFNGEIYNYIELRSELEGKGHTFYTKSDTEVIVHGYEEWGRDCPRHFNGQFAFAILDSEEPSLFLARDRLGVRPLYYSQEGARFVFASEVKSIIASGFMAPQLSPEGLDQIFGLWTNVFPQTPFANILELPPAHTMLVTPTKPSLLERYWKIPSGKQENLSTADALDGILEHLNRSVSLRLRADVPVGAYLSGGLDSGLTTALIKNWTDAQLKTFSIEFDDPRFDESEYQQEMVRFLGTEHTAFRCSARDIAENIESAVRAAERPFLRTAPVPMYLLAKLVRSEGYKVVITGEGADEFFVGYDIFKEAKVREFCARDPASRLRPLLLKRLYPYLFTDPRGKKFQEAFFLRQSGHTSDPFYGHRIRWNQAARIRDFYSPDFIRQVNGNQEVALLRNLSPDFIGLSINERTQLTEIETLLSSYLLSTQGDRVGMANSVEGRFVFLDHELIEFAARVPDRLKMPGLQEKALLKRIGRKLLPEKILNRKKYPYRAPDMESFLFDTAGRDILARTLESREVEAAGIFDWKKVGELLRRSLNPSSGKISTSDNLVLMAALTSQMFHREFFHAREDRRYFEEGDQVRRFVNREERCLKRR